ncbi:DsbA family protein [Mesorhizobium sp. Mes31]|uniref:DsbA family protein n=1 Tax=Mesorhizobium sp. Mes31 TaxID=2926017 RepID=UPI002118AC10|nr:DsbA family protein [Mesorhizobium sp. Mes31]
MHKQRILLLLVLLCATPFATAQQVPTSGGAAMTPEQIMNDPDIPFVGSNTADVTIAEFMDYNCPYCKKSHSALKKLLASDPRIRVLYKEWPIFGPVSEYAARLAIAAKWQGRYAIAHDALMSAPRRFTANEEVRAVLRTAGIDLKKLDADAAKHEAEITLLLARNNLQAETIGLQGTPAWIVGPFLIPGGLDFAQLQEAVAEARAKDARK